MVKTPERLLRRHESVIVGPSRNHAVQLLYHVDLIPRAHRVDYLVRRLRKLLHVLLARLDQQCAVPILAYVEVEEVDSSSMCVISVFSSESSKPLSFRNAMRSAFISSRVRGFRP